MKEVPSAGWVMRGKSCTPLVMIASVTWTSPSKVTAIVSISWLCCFFAISVAGVKVMRSMFATF